MKSELKAKRLTTEPLSQVSIDFHALFSGNMRDIPRFINSLPKNIRDNLYHFFLNILQQSSQLSTNHILAEARKDKERLDSENAQLKSQITDLEKQINSRETNAMVTEHSFKTDREYIQYLENLTDEQKRIIALQAERDTMYSSAIYDKQNYHHQELTKNLACHEEKIKSLENECRQKEQYIQLLLSTRKVYASEYTQTKEQGAWQSGKLVQQSPAQYILSTESKENPILDRWQAQVSQRKDEGRLPRV